MDLQCVLGAHQTCSPAGLLHFPYMLCLLTGRESDQQHGYQPQKKTITLLLCACCPRRYGAVPVVRKTGGLADTVRDVDSHAPGEANGYTFDGTDEGSLHGALDRWAWL